MTTLSTGATQRLDDTVTLRHYQTLIWACIDDQLDPLNLPLNRYIQLRARIYRRVCAMLARGL